MMIGLSRIRLFLVGGAALMFLGGLMVAIGRWYDAETDRAFVEAAARAVNAPQQRAASGVRYWAPGPGGQPALATRMSLEAADRIRALPAVPSPETTGLQRLPQPAAPRPGTAVPLEKPPAAPR